MNIESVQEKLAELCNTLARLSFKPPQRRALLSLLKMTENLRDLLVAQIDAVDRQKPDR